ncbi:MAG: META domain-containing protein, partial [Pseudomonadota bacterium]
MTSQKRTTSKMAATFMIGLMAAASLAVPTATAFEGFEGTRWRVIQLGEKVVGMAGDLHFDKDRVGGASACNFFSGKSTFADKDGLKVEVDRMTRKGCSGEALELERGYLAVLESVRSYAFEDDAKTVLVLKGEDDVLLAKLRPIVQFKLENTPLKVVSYLFDGGLYNVTPGTKPVMAFKNGKVSGNTGCTKFEGTYERKEQTVKIVLERPFAKAESCPEDDVQQDRMVLENLELTTR